MTQPRNPVPGPRATPRKQWRRPTVTILAASSAELAGGGSFDGTDLS